MTWHKPIPAPRQCVLCDIPAGAVITIVSSLFSLSLLITGIGAVTLYRVAALEKSTACLCERMDRHMGLTQQHELNDQTVQVQP